jgi:hypothetical protein
MQQMAHSSFFPTAGCEVCGKTVLTYIAFNSDGNQKRFCVHCDNSIKSGPKWVTADELALEGYQIGAPPAMKTGKGCGTGCGTCSTRGH